MSDVRTDLDGISVGVAMITAVMDGKDQSMVNAVESYINDGMDMTTIAQGILVVAGVLSREWEREGGNPRRLLQEIGVNVVGYGG